MTDQWTNRLSEYLDDELTPAEGLALTAHLESCAHCRDTLAELSAVVARARTLPDRDPEADLWTGIRAAMDAPQVVSLESRRKARRFTFSLPQLVGLAAALILVSGGSAVLVSSGAFGTRDSTGLAQVTPAPAIKSQAVVFDRRGRSDEAINDLQQVLDHERGRLDSTTVRVLTQNLALIDRAIEQARKALEADPNNAYLNDHLARTMRKKIEVLRRAADLASQS